LAQPLRIQRPDLGDQVQQSGCGQRSGLGEDDGAVANGDERRDRGDVERGGELALCLDVGLSEGDVGAVDVLLAGLLIGALTGFFGVGGGFVIVSVLVVALRFPIATAVGTSLVVIALNSGVSLAARWGSASITWEVIAPFTAAAVVGSFAGQRVADRLPATALTRAFAVLLVLVAGYVAVRAVLGLTWSQAPQSGSPQSGSPQSGRGSVGIPSVTQSCMPPR
jgi:hypothetical protein